MADCPVLGPSRGRCVLERRELAAAEAQHDGVAGDHGGRAAQQARGRRLGRDAEAHVARPVADVELGEVRRDALARELARQAVGDGDGEGLQHQVDDARVQRVVEPGAVVAVGDGSRRHVAPGPRQDVRQALERRAVVEADLVHGAVPAGRRDEARLRADVVGGGCGAGVGGGGARGGDVAAAADLPRAVLDPGGAVKGQYGEVEPGRVELGGDADGTQMGDDLVGVRLVEDKGAAHVDVAQRRVRLAATGQLAHGLDGHGHVGGGGQHHVVVDAVVAGPRHGVEPQHVPPRRLHVVGLEQAAAQQLVRREAPEPPGARYAALGPRRGLPAPGVGGQVGQHGAARRRGGHVDGHGLLEQAPGSPRTRVGTYVATVGAAAARKTSRSGPTST